MKPSLQLRVSQQLTMTPQLQQAIKLLQLSSLELQQEIQEALDSNPLLEIQEDEQGQQSSSEHGEHPNSQGETQSDSPDADERSLDSSSGDTKNDDFGIDAERNSDDGKDAENATLDGDDNAAGSDIPEDLPVDSNWDDIYPTQSSGTSSAQDDGYNFDDRNAPTQNLAGHLLWQLNLTPMSDIDKAIATTIIDALDHNGYLSASLEEIRDSVLKEDGLLEDDETLELDEVNAVLRRVQHFDPPGVAARNLQECLLLQLAQTPAHLPWREQAIQLVSDFLPLVASHDYTQLMRKMRLKEDELKQVMGSIQTLNPHPGAGLQSDITEYVIPDVIVTKKSGRWRVELNPDVAPRLRVNATYAALAKTSKSPEDAGYIKSNLQEARWFIKSLMSRNETLLKVATRIVEHQIGFFEYGEEAMKPLVLHDIAEAVEMHESTISRITTQKYMLTPMGIFELKYFFSSHVSTTTGGECSAKAIQAIIRKLVAAENKRKPLSDSQMAKILAEKDIQIARRTVAKYRESLNIPPSNERKRLV
jgi:RNA polymerase sigma-54 factor